MPFVSGVELDRAAYMYEEWRGPVLAKFLIELRDRSQDMSLFDPKKSFSLKDYIYRLVGHIKTYKTSVKDEITSVVDFLEKEFMLFYEKIPVSFCHGDYHPMNIIWSKDDIQCVIDWEFLGYKSEIYDIANLMGCIGVEDPSALTGELVKSFIVGIKEAQVISDVSWKYLGEFIVALRFAWLSEWLRRHDEEMITLELDYMRLLMENKRALHESWKL
jgi:homoserine kinase type II